LILDTNLRLEAVLAGAITTSQPEYHVCFVDWNQNAETTPPAVSRGALNSTSDVTILAAPGSVNPRREVQKLVIYNKDTVPATVTVKTDDGTTERIERKASVPASASLCWEKDVGWYISTASTPAGAPSTRQVFTSGSGTYTTPSGCTRIDVQAVGGGSGGCGGNGGAASTAGGATTFSTLTANGGLSQINTGGGAPSAAAATGGDINISGGVGSQGGLVLAGGQMPGTSGAPSFFGGGGYGHYNSTAGAGTAPGAGGGGGAAGTAGTTSGAGGNSGAYVRKLIASPAATYSYAVGAGGAGTSAGAGGTAGAAGAAGIIIVDEFY
jgi:hypothetical protein